MREGGDLLGGLDRHHVRHVPASAWPANTGSSQEHAPCGGGYSELHADTMLLNDLDVQGYSSTEAADPGTSSGRGQPPLAKRYGMTQATFHSTLCVGLGTLHLAVIHSANL